MRGSKNTVVDRILTILSIILKENCLKNSAGKIDIYVKSKSINLDLNLDKPQNDIDLNIKTKTVKHLGENIEETILNHGVDKDVLQSTYPRKEH